MHLILERVKIDLDEDEIRRLIDAVDHYEAYLHLQQRHEEKFRELLGAAAEDAGQTNARAFAPRSRGCIRARIFSGGATTMLKDANLAAKEHPSSMMEDFGRFSPVEMLDSDPDITDESFLDEAYGEKNAGA